VLLVEAMFAYCPFAFFPCSVIAFSTSMFDVYVRGRSDRKCALIEKNMG